MENDTVIPTVYQEDFLKFWPIDTTLAVIHITAVKYGEIEIPFPAQQPYGDSWIETYPSQTDYYCLAEEKDIFTQYFLDGGCFINNIEYFKKKRPLYNVVWKSNSWSDAIINLIKTDAQSEGQLVYHQKSLNKITGELFTTNTQDIIREFDAYYNFKNILTINTRNKKYDPALYTKDNPLVLHPYVHTEIVAENPENQVSYTGIFYTQDVKRNLEPNIEQ